jgi:hypothetical protein
VRSSRKPRRHRNRYGETTGGLPPGAADAHGEHMNHLLFWVTALLLLGCAGAERSAVPPLAPRACPGAVVRSAVQLKALSGCTHVRGDLSIEMHDVVSLRALDSLWSVDGTLGIHGSRKLESLRGLERLHRVGHLAIVDNALLAQLHGVGALQSAGGVSVIQNPRLRDLRGLERLERLEGLVLVANGLVSLRGLDRLESIGDLVISDHARLIDVSALSSLRRADNLHLARIPFLAPRLGFFDALERVTGVISVSEIGGAGGPSERYLRDRQDASREKAVFAGPTTW